MSKLIACTLVLCCAGSALVAAPQKRTKPKGPEDVPALLEAAGEAWKGERFGECIQSLQSAMGLVSAKRAEALLAALPPAPAGWEVEPDSSDDARTNPFAAAVASAVGNVVQRSYRQTSGEGHADVTLTADSPLVGMFQMWITNPALLDADSELIEYDAHKAVLRKQGDGLDLQILIGGKHVCEVQAGGMSEEQLFKLFDQDVVNRLAAVLAR
jgi:hypothetical protein